MRIYFDRYFYKSNAASAILLKRRIQIDNETFGNKDYLVFSTTKNYKGTSSDEIEHDSKELIQYGRIRFTSMLKLYIGFFLFYNKNSNQITSITSQSSPGFNLFYFSLLPWRKKVLYIVQDVYPDGIMKTLNLLWLLSFIKPILKICYSRIKYLETISSDMQKYLLHTYGVKPKITYNPNPYPTDLRTKVLDENEIKIGYSGNFSNSHGYHGPKNLLDCLIQLDNRLVIEIRGFGKYYDQFNLIYKETPIRFGGPMNSKEYLEYIESLDVILLFQEDDYHKYCLSCKFNSSIEFNKPIIYVGPICDITRYITLQNIGLCLSPQNSKEEILQQLNYFFENLHVFVENAQNNKAFQLDEYLK